MRISSYSGLDSASRFPARDNAVQRAREARKTDDAQEAKSSEQVAQLNEGADLLFANSSLTTRSVLQLRTAGTLAALADERDTSFDWAKARPLAAGVHQAQSADTASQTGGTTTSSGAGNNGNGNGYGRGGSKG